MPASRTARLRADRATSGEGRRGGFAEQRADERVGTARLRSRSTPTGEARTVRRCAAATPARPIGRRWRRGRAPGARRAAGRASSSAHAAARPAGGLRRHRLRAARAPWRPAGRWPGRSRRPSRRDHSAPQRWREQQLAGDQSVDRRRERRRTAGGVGRGAQAFGQRPGCLDARHPATASRQGPAQGVDELDEGNEDDGIAPVDTALVHPVADRGGGRAPRRRDVRSRLDLAPLDCGGGSRVVRRYISSVNRSSVLPRGRSFIAGIDRDHSAARACATSPPATSGLALCQNASTRGRHP